MLYVENVNTQLSYCLPIPCLGLCPSTVNGIVPRVFFLHLITRSNDAVTKNLGEREFLKNDVSKNYTLGTRNYGTIARSFKENARNPDIPNIVQL